MSRNRRRARGGGTSLPDDADLLWEDPVIPVSVKETAADKYTRALQDIFLSFKQDLQGGLDEIRSGAGLDGESLREENNWPDFEEITLDDDPPIRQEPAAKGKTGRRKRGGREVPDARGGKRRDDAGYKSLSDDLADDFLISDPFADSAGRGFSAMEEYDRLAFEWEATDLDYDQRGGPGLLVAVVLIVLAGIVVILALLYTFDPFGMIS